MTNIYFITSSRSKLMHARHLAQAYDVSICEKRNYGVAYSEPRSEDRDELLKRSYEDALARWKKGAGSSDVFLFIEDTSVIIEALSGDKEFPGVDIKFWMRTASFENLDLALKAHGNDRRVTVRSDVLLHMPEQFRRDHKIELPYKIFTGSKCGAIVSDDAAVATNLMYPWLDGKTFNKWFVPAGANRALSAMSIEEADTHDFRQGSIGAMMAFLAERGVFGLRRGSRIAAQSPVLPLHFPPLLIVTGLPCAGKTTLGEYLSAHCGYYHMEASDFMRRAFYERHGYASELSIHDFAEGALLTTPGIVVEAVVGEIEHSKSERIVVTGFRSAKEVEIFRELYQGHLEVKLWHVTADENVRFRRSQKRARRDAASNIRAFRSIDRLQNRMGLATIKDTLSEEIITNDGTKRNYLLSCLKRIGTNVEVEPNPVPDVRQERPKRLEHAILIGLATASEVSTTFMSTTEIAHLLNHVFAAEGIATSKNNVSRYFNFRPNPFFLVQIIDGKQKFALSATGRSRGLQLSRDLRSRKESGRDQKRKPPSQKPLHHLHQPGMAEEEHFPEAEEGLMDHW